jgi:hypothetical protein
MSNELRTQGKWLTGSTTAVVLSSVLFSFAILASTLLLIEKDKLTMSTVNVTPSIVSFKPTSVASERTSHENSARETKVQRENRAKALWLSGGFTWIGRAFNAAARAALQVGQTIAVPELNITAVSAVNDKQAACVVCHGVHDLSNPTLSAKITAVRKGDKVYLLSDTCRKDYFGVYAAKALTPESLIAYRNDFPKGKTK